MAKIFGIPTSVESFILPEGEYGVYTEVTEDGIGSVQSLTYPYVTFEESGPLPAVADYLDERGLAIYLPMDASTHVITENVPYTVNGHPDSPYKKALDLIRAQEAAGNLPLGSHRSAERALLCRVFEQTTWVKYLCDVVEQSKAEQ